jgi:hypothetical protein
MRTRTCIVLLTAGAIMAVAVTAQPGFIDLHLAGLILVITAGIGLWPRGGRALVRLTRVRLRRLLDEMPPVEGVRVPLDDLLSGSGPRERARDERQAVPALSPAARRADLDVWSSWGGHQELGRGSPEAAGGDQR